MGKRTFTALPRPALISSLRHRTPDECIEDIRLSEREGAHGFLLHIQLLDPAYRNAEALRPIFAATERPVMALCYRTKGFEDDEVLAALQLDAVRAGAAAVDMPLYRFDVSTEGSLCGSSLPFAAAKPREVSMDPAVVARQREFIEQVHALGGEVLISAHVGVPLTAEQGVSLAREIRARGADIVKIITGCPDVEGALEVLRTDAALAEALDCPYLYQCAKQYGAFVRLAAPLFGSYYVLCHAAYGELSNREKPLLADARRVLEGIHWRLCGNPGN